MTRVLLVDDEKSIRRTLGEFLRADGYEVVEAEDVESAQRHLGESAFDVVVTDIVLPRISGVELLRRLHETAPHVQVIMMTGEPTVETATESLRAGANDYLFKPINKAAILRAVTNAARLKSLADAKRALEAENLAHQENLEHLVRERTGQLERSEGRFRALVETTSDWVWEVDARGRYTYASPRVQDLLGYTPAEVLGRWPFDFMPPAEAQQTGALFRDAAARREPFAALERTSLHKSGRRVILETTAVPIFEESGQFAGYRGVDRDVTDRKRLEIQLRQAQKLEAIGHLAGGVAHDFNNILAAIMMHLGLMQMRDILDEETRLGLKDLGLEVERAASLTRQLLMFSRRAVLEVKPLDLDEVVAGLMKMLRRLIGEHIQLEFGNKTALPLVEADAGMMEQIIMNLVVNARDAMPSGGKITLATQALDLPEAEVLPGGNRRPGRFVTLVVSDTGSGMDTETLGQIFDPFFTTKEPGRGTGLGLATVHGIVAQHKGWIEVESQVNRGTTFRIFLPALDASRLRPTQPSRQPRASGGVETVLVVEDQPEVRRLITRILRVHGYTVHEAGNGQEAVTLWHQLGGDFDLLLTDMVMPEGMTGLELTTRLRGHRPELKVIISSGYSAEIAQRGAIDKADLVYLPKPYDSQVLVDTVRKCLDQRREPKSGA